MSDQFARMSKWAGVHQPMEFIIQRKDYQVSQGFVKGYFRIINIPVRSNEFSEGSKFNLITTSDKTRSYTLTVASVFLTSNSTQIVVDVSDVFEAHKINFNNAFINVIRAGYYIESQVYISDLSGDLDLKGVLRTKTDAYGIGIVNVQKVLSSNLTLENRFDYNAVNAPQLNQGGMYQVRYRERYTGLTGSTYSRS